MTTFQFENLKKQFIYDSDGKPEYVVLTVSEYENLLQIIEDYNLGKAMMAAENSPKYGKEEALKLLENDTE